MIAYIFCIAIASISPQSWWIPLFSSPAFFTIYWCCKGNLSVVDRIPHHSFLTQVQTYILLTGCHKVLLMSVLRMWFYINYHISLSSLVSCSWHLFTRYCLGIVMRDKILTYKFKFSSRAFLFIFFPCLGAASLRHAYNFIQANKVLNIVTRFRLLSSQSCQQSGVFSGRG